MAASGSRPSAPSLATLPDDLLLACFEQLQDPLERCTALIAGRQLSRGSRVQTAGGAAARALPPLCLLSPLLQAPPVAGSVLPLAAPGR